MSCDPERVTGFVDGELDPAAASAMAAHLETCAACRAQADSERALRVRLAGLRAPELPARLEARVRDTSRVRPNPAGTLVRWALPVAAVLVLVGWLRGQAPFVAWDLARDHDKCFSRQPLPAKVFTGDPRVVAEWFESQGTHVPALPAEVGELRLVGARYCPLVSLASAPHVYYASAGGHLSLFVVPHEVRAGDTFVVRVRGDNVRLLRVEGELVGIVGESDGDVRALETALRPLLAARASARDEPRVDALAQLEARADRPHHR